MEIRLPPDQEARLIAHAASSGRSVEEIVWEAITLWEAHWRQQQFPKRTRAEAAAHILELRKGNVLPRARR